MQINFPPSSLLPFFDVQRTVANGPGINQMVPANPNRVLLIIVNAFVEASYEFGFAEMMDINSGLTWDYDVQNWRVFTYADWGPELGREWFIANGSEGKKVFVYDYSYNPRKFNV